MRRKALLVLSLYLAAGLIGAAPAMAYVDPGVGGMFYQILLLVGATVAGFLAAFRSKISAYFSKKRDQADNTDDQSGQE